MQSWNLSKRGINDVRRNHRSLIGFAVDKFRPRRIMGPLTGPGCNSRTVTRLMRNILRGVGPCPFSHSMPSGRPFCGTARRTAIRVFVRTNWRNQIMLDALFPIAAVAALFLGLAMVPGSSKPGAASTSEITRRSIYDFTVKDIGGSDVVLSKYKGLVCLIVNVASQ